MSVWKQFVKAIRPYLVVNSDHIDPHSVYKAATYRRATATLTEVQAQQGREPEYKSGTDPYGKVSNNYYFKRDDRRHFPKTVVIGNPVLTSLDKEGAPAAYLPLEGTQSASFTDSVTPGKEIKLEYSEYPTEYETVTYYK